MAGASIRIDADAAPFAAVFGRLLHAVGDLTPAMRAIAGEMLFSTQRRFEREAGPGGNAWARLAASTIRRNPRRAPPAKILRDTVSLFGSLTTEADASSAAVGTNVVYAAMQQFGGDIARPAREASAWLRTARHGAGRNKAGARVGSKLRFARAGDRAKSMRQVVFTVPAHVIRVPARPFLGVDAADERVILDTIEDHLARAAGGAP